MTHVPYTALHLPDIIEQRVDFGLFAWTSVQGLVQSGDLRLIATSGAKRLADAPDAMTFEEQGIHATVDAWLSLSAPRNLTPAITERLNGVVRSFLDDADVRTRLANDIFAWQTMSTPQFNSFVSEQIALWSPRVSAVLTPKK